MRLREIDPWRLLIWVCVLCTTAWMIAQTVRAIAHGEPPP